MNGKKPVGHLQIRWRDYVEKNVVVTAWDLVQVKFDYVLGSRSVVA